MKANLKANQTAKTARSSEPEAGQASLKPLNTSSSGSHPHAPSVPISIYRDLADELKAANHHVNLLTSQNEALRQQNQSLRAEVVRVIESAAKLQRILQTASESSNTSTPANSTSTPKRAPATQPISQQGTPSSSPSLPTVQKPGSEISDAMIAELDQTLMAQLGQSLATNSQTNAPAMDDFSDHNHQQAKVYGPYCDLAVSKQLQHVSQPKNDGNDSSEATQQLDPQLSWQALEAEFLTEQVTDSLVTTDPNLGGSLDSDKAKPINGLWLTLTLVVVIVTAFSAGFLVVLPFIQVDGES